MLLQNINRFQFILSYQDYLTKFVLLGALMVKVSKITFTLRLLYIYTHFGAPAILHFVKGRELLF